MSKEPILRKYARLIVQTGANVQKGQPVVIRGSVDSIELLRLISEEAYAAGASSVNVNLSDEKLSRLNFEHMALELFKEVPEHRMQESLYYIGKGACMINIISANPDALQGIDPNKIKTANQAYQQHPKAMEIMTYTMANKGQWTIAAYPSIAWAKKVFPHDSDEVAYEKLKQAILKATRVSEDSDPLENWKEHNKTIKTNTDKMNDYRFKSLHFKNKLGSDFEVGLVDGHIWGGGYDFTDKGVQFNPNMPTEEVFTMPHKYQVNGKVVATLPLNYNGNLIEDFYFIFKDGKVVDYDAKKNKEILKVLVETDEGSCRLGEVALVPYASPISQSKILFFNTLFDENASCHLALGRAYPSNIENGASLDKEAMDKVGSNFSMTHVDFMVGSPDLEIIGTTQDGKKVPVFKNGNWAI